MRDITENEMLKESAIRIALDHKAHCPGESCGIALWTLLRLLSLAGIDLTEEEREELI